MYKHKVNENRHVKNISIINFEPYQKTKKKTLNGISNPFIEIVFIQASQQNASYDQSTVSQYSLVDKVHVLLI